MDLVLTTRQIIALFVLSLLTTLPALANTTIEGIRVWPAPENTRLVFDLTAQPNYSYFSLQNPQRLVIDFAKKEKNNKK
jgi:N-acetylmuramoyl-L-alanine amidase